jgi:hypothetical protein
MRKTAIAISIAFILGFIHLAYGQLERGPRPRFFSEFKPVLGGWSEYEIKLKTGASSKMRIAVVGKEGDAYWYETSLEGRGGKTITKALVTGDPNDQKNVKSMIIKIGNQPAREVPVGMRRQAKPEEQPVGKMIEKESETVTVPAGTFQTKRVQYQKSNETMDSWIHKDVSPYGVIKTQSKDFEMVLLAYGTGATTQITETPKKFERPQGKFSRPIPKKGPPLPQTEEDEEDD